jgi:hypothetical protein
VQLWNKQPRPLASTQEDIGKQAAIEKARGTAWGLANFECDKHQGQRHDDVAGAQRLSVLGDQRLSFGLPSLCVGGHVVNHVHDTVTSARGVPTF